MSELKLKGVTVVDTFAEAFPMWGARIVITAESAGWAGEAARSVTGFATSVIGCKCEAGVERVLDPAETPDGRPGVSVLLFAPDRDGLAKRLVERVGQSVLTCPTTACFSGLEGEETVDVGGQLRYFGDGYQASKVLDGSRYWRVPVMEGEFLVEERFGVVEGVAGGNIIMLGRDAESALRASEAAAAATSSSSPRTSRRRCGRPRRRRRRCAPWRGRSCRSRAGSRAAAARSARGTRR